MFKRLLLIRQIPTSFDTGLLMLRVVVFLSLFLKHGTEKIFGFQAMAAHFPNPLHIGSVPSLAFALLSDGICSLLLVMGLATRWAALVVFANIFVAWAFVHHFPFFDGQQGGHGELMVLYLAASLALFLAGAGRFSIDALVARGASKGEPRS